MNRVAHIGDISVGEGEPLALIAGPCVIESRDSTMRMAGEIKKIAGELEIPFIFKASYDKANRSSADSYRGPGMERGLEILAEVRRNVGVPVTSDIHETLQADAAGRALDLLQIPAFLCRQTDLLLAAAATGLPVNVKKGQFMAPWEMENAVGKLKKARCADVLLTERGTCFGYNNLVSDMRSIPLMQELGCPVVYDATHSVQRPGAQGKASGGDRGLVEPLALAAVAAGCDALFIETHENPDKALSDAATQLPLKELKNLLKKILAVKSALSH